MAASHTFTVTYDGRIVRDAVRAFVLRRCFREQPRLWLAEALALAALVWRLAHGHDGWIETLLSVAVLVDGVYTSGNGGELTYAPRQQADLDHPIEKVGKELRALFAWKQQDEGYTEGSAAR